ncbi:class F sortase [Blastococcus goldschmidtiae]|uniref:Class F sortase n=1 Tax=Blastococcus goldschmidtiae TaxID=3075546 RepID=A0ABU2K403_9ACTN|nr:class F sortase [Blastococcus sp. DSM 46792]MDT0274900.1 class F sortase [Blastococcus sp. DSM 46792]
MPDRPRTARPGSSETGAGGAARIVGPYPPPPPPARTPVSDAGILDLLARPPAVTRYGRSARLGPGANRPRAGRAWAAASVLLAAASVGAVVLFPQDAGPSARLAAPLAVEAAPLTGAPPLQGRSVSPAAAPRELPASEPVRLQIPALGVSSEIMTLGLESDGSMEVPPGAYPVGWYDGSPTPGRLGPAVLAGHVDWEGEPGAFYGLRELRAGDTVVVDRADGTVATFRVDRVEEHPKDEFPTEEVYGGIDHVGLRLITCGGAFEDDTGDYQANVIAFASLAEATD